MILQNQGNLPRKIGLEQMRVICHISKKTARYLLKSGLVPCIDTGKKTRQYIINTKDVIAYLKSANPARKDIRPQLVTTRQVGTMAVQGKPLRCGNGLILTRQKTKTNLQLF